MKILMANGRWQMAKVGLAIVGIAGTLVLPALAQTPVVYSSQRFTGTPNNRAITIHLLTQGVLHGTNGVFGVPEPIQPTNGVARFQLLPANYALEIDQVPTLFPFGVPDSTNEYSIWDLVSKGLYFLTTNRGPVVITNIIYVTGTNGGTVTLPPGLVTNGGDATLSSVTLSNGANTVDINLHGNADMGGTSLNIESSPAGATFSVNGAGMYLDAIGILHATLAGDAASATNLNAAKLASGTVPAARLPGSLGDWAQLDTNVLSQGAAAVGIVVGADSTQFRWTTNLDGSVTLHDANGKVVTNMTVYGTAEFKNAPTVNGVPIASGGGVTNNQFLPGTPTGNGSGFTNLQGSNVQGSITTTQLVVNGTGLNIFGPTIITNNGNSVLVSNGNVTASGTIAAGTIAVSTFTVDNPISGSVTGYSGSLSYTPLPSGSNVTWWGRMWIQTNLSGLINETVFAITPSGGLRIQPDGASIWAQDSSVTADLGFFGDGSGLTNIAGSQVTGATPITNGLASQSYADSVSKAPSGTIVSYTRPMLKSMVDPIYSGNTNSYWLFGANVTIPDWTLDYYSNGVFTTTRFMFTPEGPLVASGFSDNSSYQGTNRFNMPVIATNTANNICGTFTGSFLTPTNAWALNTPITWGTNQLVLVSGAATGGVTGIAGFPASGGYVELVVKASGNVVFTNAFLIGASDYQNSRTITNGNTATIAIEYIPPFMTNMAIVQFRPHP